MERFISELITVDVETMRASTLVSGSPDCPRRFCWRDNWYEVIEVLEQWKRTSPEGGRAAGERYVRAHCFRVRTDQDMEAVIYCDRQMSRSKKSGWWLYTINESKND